MSKFKVIEDGSDYEILECNTCHEVFYSSPCGEVNVEWDDTRDCLLSVCPNKCS